MQASNFTQTPSQLEKLSMDSEKEVIYIVQEEDRVMTVYDILTKQSRLLTELLATINSKTLQQFDLYFTSDHDIGFLPFSRFASFPI